MGTEDGWCWMLHGDMGEDNTEAGHVGNLEWKKAHTENWIESGRHLMIMPKDPEFWSKASSDFNTGAPYTMFSGTEWAHAMIPMEDYYHYQAQKGGTAGKVTEPDKPHTSKEWQIWAYSSAAPSYLAACATVLDGKMEPLRKGTCGFTCLPGNPKGPADPEKGFASAHEAMAICGDAESFKWMKAFMKGEKPVLDQDGWAWMLHGDMGEDNTAPGHTGDLEWKKAHLENWIESGAHLMLIPKDPATWSKRSTDFNTGAPYTMMANTNYAHVMIPVDNYYAYQDQKIETSRLFSADGLLGKLPDATANLPLLAMAFFLVGSGVVVFRVARSRSAAGAKPLEEEGDESSSAEAGMLE